MRRYIVNVCFLFAWGVLCGQDVCDTRATALQAMHQANEMLELARQSLQTVSDIPIACQAVSVVMPKLDEAVQEIVAAVGSVAQIPPRRSDGFLTSGSTITADRIMREFNAGMQTVGGKLKSLQTGMGGFSVPGASQSQMSEIKAEIANDLNDAAARSSLDGYDFGLQQTMKEVEVDK